MVDERTRWEIYYPPFLGAIKAEVGSIMCSYNRINGNYSCGNNDTLNTDYKVRAGFEGWVSSGPLFEYSAGCCRTTFL